MTEFTDGTAKGKTLSLVELEKKIEALPTTEKVTELIQQAVQNLLDSGDVATTATKQESIVTVDKLNGNQWVEKTYTATKSGWYILYCQHNVGVTTPAGFIRSSNGENRINGNNNRDFCCGPIWAKAGDTISYGSIGQQWMNLRLFARG